MGLDRSLKSPLGTGFGWARGLLVGAGTLAGVAGCATPLPRTPVPEALTERAKPLDLDGIRTFGDAPADSHTRGINATAPLIRARLLASNARGQVPVERYLAISGGADNGAFGAGLLVGWGATGRRPEFTVVTGISAGALIAPFVFLGPGYDKQMAEMFTAYDSEDIYRSDVLAGLFGGSALADTTPLANLIEKYTDERMFAAIARERAKGRLLLIGTTNLDAERPVYWDVGRLAQSRHPEAIATFRKVLLASAAVPGLFPPVRFHVTANGKSYEELHVDGGVTKEVILAPAHFDFKALDAMVGIKPRRELFIIRNGKANPEWNPVKESAAQIAARSLETLIKYQGVGDLQRIYTIAQAEGIEYNLMSIPSTFDQKYPGPFNRVYMSALFKLGYKTGRGTIPWQKQPPPL